MWHGDVKVPLSLGQVKEASNGFSVSEHWASCWAYLHKKGMAAACLDQIFKDSYKIYVMRSGRGMIVREPAQSNAEESRADANANFQRVEQQQLRVAYHTRSVPIRAQHSVYYLPIQFGQIWRAGRSLSSIKAKRYMFHRLW